MKCSFAIFLNFGGVGQDRVVVNPRRNAIARFIPLNCTRIPIEL